MEEPRPTCGAASAAIENMMSFIAYMHPRDKLKNKVGTKYVLLLPFRTRIFPCAPPLPGRFGNYVLRILCSAVSMTVSHCRA